MVALALLPKASANRVYGAAALGLAAAELAVLDQHVLGGLVHGAAVRDLAGVAYVVAECDPRALEPAALAVVGNLSGLHAAYELEGDGRLRPLEAPALRCHDDDITTIQRYPGKTNESLTHLLVNLALAVAPGGFAKALAGDRVRLLDPACGRGTTLNRAVVYGLDAVGVEHDKRDVEAYEAFLLGWLQDKRLKHQTQRARLRKGRATPAQRCTIAYGAGRDAAAHRVVDLVTDDTANLRDHLAARSVDLLVCDLPYGVQHGSSAAPGVLRRSPDELLAAALPVWREVLRPGGGLALSWNLRTLARPVLVERLVGAGFELCVPADDERFAHRVDRSIQRDVVVARRAAAT
jgi:SAM-dependent methyltransferase